MSMFASMYKLPKIIVWITYYLSLAILSVYLVGCNGQNERSSIGVGKIPSTTSTPSGALVEFNASVNRAQTEKFYKTKCDSKTCIVESEPSKAPLTKPNGLTLCKVGKYESKAVSTIFFSDNGELLGANCEIDESDYQNIVSSLGSKNVFKRYLDQRGELESFQVWKSLAGYITTYREVRSATSTHGMEYGYYLYVGMQEHPHFSMFPAQ